jgi:hypothetical protein
VSGNSLGVSLLLRIIGDHVLVTKAGILNDEYFPSASASAAYEDSSSFKQRCATVESAVFTICQLLPTLIEIDVFPSVPAEGDADAADDAQRASESSSASSNTLKTLTELMNLFTQYSELSSTTPRGKALGKFIVVGLERVIAAATAGDGSRQGVVELEEAHNLWCEYREKEGQALDTFLTAGRAIEGDERDSMEVTEAGPLFYIPCSGSKNSFCVVM